MFETLDAIDPGRNPAGDVARMGGKAFNCARLRHAGFPVPDGLVVLADAADADLAHIVDHAWFMQFAPTQRFAVRSSGIGEDSAGHSFAGIHETFLNVGRAEIVSAARACRASTTAETARAYRESRQLASDGAGAVLIQPMIAALIAGVAFTRHPVTGADELLIDAAPGLGDALVSGRIEPDHYRLRKPDGAVIERVEITRPVSAPRLTGQQIADLARLLVGVEQHYGSPQDLEWAIDDHAIWLLQSRPITVVPLADPVSAERAPDQALPAPPGAVDIEWTRANLAEVIPEQATPQALDAFDYLLNNGERLFMGGLLAPEEQFGPPFKVFGGRMYFNLTQLCHVARIGGAPPAAVMRSLGHSEGIRQEDEIVQPVPLATRLRAVPSLLRLLWLDMRAPRLVEAADAENARAIARLSAAHANVEAIDDEAIWALLAEWRTRGPEHMVVILVHGSVMMIEEQLRKLLALVGADYDRFVYAQLATGEPSVSTRQAFDLVEVADIARHEPAAVAYLRDHEGGFHDYRQALHGTRFLVAFDRFLERYGHRGVYESEWSLPRYREDPSPLLFALRTHVLNPPAESRDEIGERLAHEATQAWAALDAKLSPWQRLLLRPRIRSLVTKLKRRYVGREHCRSELVRVLSYARQLHLALAGRFVSRGWIEQRDDYFMLLTREIDAVIRKTADPAGLRALVRERHAQRAREAQLVMPFFMRQSEIGRVLAGSHITDIHAAEDAEGGATAAASFSAGEVLTGLCVSRGTVEAEVVVIRDPRDFALMRRGAILVAPATDPSWTPLFTLAAGVIVEVGGILSHASTVAREYGVPALANVKQATHRLKSGDRVRLEASQGRAVRVG